MIAFVTPLSYTPTSACALLTLLLAASLSAAPERLARADAGIEQQRKMFVTVERALKAGNRGPFLRHRKTLQSYPLYPYLVYRDLHNRLARAKEKEIADFLGTYGGELPVAEKLRHRWLAQIARRGRWQTFLRYYRESVTVESKKSRCLYASALIHAGPERKRQAEKAMKSLWLVDFSQPPQCDFVFKWGFKQGLLTNELVWQRALLTWRRGRVGLTNYLGVKLTSDARHEFQALKWARYHPRREALKMRKRFLSASVRTASRGRAGDVMVFAVRRLLKKDPVAAGKLWDELRRGCAACVRLRAVEKEIGIAAARRLAPGEAYRRLSQLPAEYRDAESRYWRIRAALRMQRWDRVLKSIDDLAAENRSLPQWRYWRARALAGSGRIEERAEARGIWRDLAGKDGYYGYLAADRLGRAYPHALTALVFTEAELRTLFEVHPAVARVRELLRFGKMVDAGRELLVLMERLGAGEKLKFAFLADRWGWPFGAIRGISSSGAKRHRLQHFPMPFRDLVKAEADRQKVPIEWVYGIMRRESAFVPDARSPAGALGLMQVRPLTARDVATRLGLGRFSKRKLLSPKLNVRLGTAYIKQLYRRNGRNLAISLAGYNAGPTNVRRWLKNAPVSDGAVWVDTIPFDETRLYVRAVLFYTLVYRHRLGKLPVRIGELMKF